MRPAQQRPHLTSLREVVRPRRGQKATFFPLRGRSAKRGGGQ
jgi:hypothetical protein